MRDEMGDRGEGKKEKERESDDNSHHPMIP